MTSLLLSLEWLASMSKKGTLDQARLTRQLRGSVRQGYRLRRLADHLLDTTRLESGQLALERAPFDLVELVREVVDRFSFELERASCPVQLDAPAPVHGQWDRARLDQVLSNLLSNAIKFGPGRPIEIRVLRAEECARLTVTDHGIGIDPAHVDRIFDRFARSVSPDQYGGLGLYISRQIVELHGGTIRVSSQPGAGTSVTVELPLAYR